MAAAGAVCVWIGLGHSMVDVPAVGPIAFLETVEGGAERALALKALAVAVAVLAALRWRLPAALAAGGTAGLYGSATWGVVKSSLEDLDQLKSMRTLADTAREIEKGIQVGSGLWVCAIGLALLVVACFVVPRGWRRGREETGQAL